MMVVIVSSICCCTADESWGPVSPQASCVRITHDGSAVPMPGSVLPSVTFQRMPLLVMEPVRVSMARIASAMKSV